MSHPFLHLPPGVARCLIILCWWLAVGHHCSAATNRSSYYDGDTDGVRFEHQAHLNASVAITLEAWIYRQDATRCETIISNGYQDSYWLGFCPSKLRFYRSGRQFVDADVSIASKLWTHVAASYDGTHVRFYVNGEPAGTKALANSGLGAQEDVYLGRDASSALNSFRFQGFIDEARIWSVARSAEEIRTGMWREELRADDLAAVFPHGGISNGARADGTSLRGHAASTLPALTPSGVLPQRMVVPYVGATARVTLDGTINRSIEYPRAEQLLLRYPGKNDGLGDATAYFVRDDDYLYVAIDGARRAAGGRSDNQSNVALSIDANNSRGTAPGVGDRQLATNVDVFSTARYTYVGTGSGWQINLPPLSTSLFAVGKATAGAGGEFAAPHIEFRIHKSLLGEWNEIDRIMLSQQAVTGPGDDYHAPENATAGAPATWVPMTYGDTTEGLPLVTGAVGVVNANDPSQGIEGVTVRLRSRSSPATYDERITRSDGWIRTDISPARSFDGFHEVPVGLNDGLLVDVVPPPGYRFVEPEVSKTAWGTDPLPAKPAPTTYVTFPGCAGGECRLETVTFKVIPPSGPIAIADTGSTHLWPRTQIRTGASRRSIEPAKGRVFGTNLHDQVSIFLARPSCANDLDATSSGCAAGVDYFEVTEFTLKEFSGETYIEFTTPDIPPSRLGTYRISIHDQWSRPGVNPSFASSWIIAPSRVSVGIPPYPLTHGFSFRNTRDESSLQEMTAVFGGGLYDPITGCIPIPHYFILWFPVYYDLATGNGSCFGMAGTSRLFAEGRLRASDYDSAALFANGLGGNPPNPSWSAFETGPLPGHWSLRGICPTRWVSNNLWAQVRRAHGTQFSDEAITALLPQLWSTGADGSTRVSFDGDPINVMSRLASASQEHVLCMRRGPGSGHCVTPLGVQNSMRILSFGTGPSGIETTALEAASGFSVISVYDNNRPDTVRYVEINTATNEFRYPYLTGYRGQGISTMPMSLFRSENLGVPGLEDAARYLHLLLFAEADVLHEDGSGGAWGWTEGGDFIDTLKGAKSVAPFHEGGALTDRRNVSLILPPGRAPKRSTVNVRGERYVFHGAGGPTMVQLEVNDAAKGAADVLEPVLAGNELCGLTFKPQKGTKAFTPKLGLVKDGTKSLVFQLEGMQLGGGEKLAFEGMPDRNCVCLRNLSDGMLMPTVKIDSLAMAKGVESSAQFEPFPVPPGADLFIETANWPDVSSAQFGVDFDNDGMPDAVTTISSGGGGRPVPLVSWSQPAAVGYGTALTAAQLNASVSGDIPGSFRYTPASGTVLNAGTHTLNVTFTPTDTVAFAPASGSAQLTVTKAPLTITADNKTRAAGTANPPLTASYSGFVNGDDGGDLDAPVVLTTSATPGSAPGTHPIAASGAADANYAITLVPGTLTISDKEVPAITWSAPSAIRYGQPLGAAQLNASVSGGVGGTFQYLPAAGIVLNAGSHTLFVAFFPDDTTRYATSVKTAILTVSKAPLTISADNKSRAQGTANPPLTASYSGLVNGDATGTLDAPVVLTTSATPESLAGSYPITVSGPADTNYAITFVPGTLTITQEILSELPSVELRYDATRMELSWADDPALRLMQSANLLSWVPVEDVEVEDGEARHAVLYKGPHFLYFRLERVPAR